MTNTPSPDEDRELIEALRELVRLIRKGERVSSYRLEQAADRLESLLSDRAKLEEALKRIALGSFNDEWVVIIAREALNRSTDHTP